MNRRILVCLVFFQLIPALWSVAADQITGKSWTEVPTPFRAVNVTAVGGSIWVCGADELIMASTDHARSWEAKHQNRDGEVLTSIVFIDEKVGYAAGTGGLLLGTADGGQTWKSYKLPGTIRELSFGDPMNGIAIFTASDEVKLTHDGGETWEEIAALRSDDLRAFTGVLSVVALDKSHYLMIRRHPEVADAFVVSNDGGKSWKLIPMQDDATNRVLARQVMAHEGEYWAFGMELVHRDKGGGYGVPMTLHSKDGENWKHGAHGPNEFGRCNSQGCYLWDGALEVLYGEHETFWNMPQDSSMGEKWAISSQVVCVVTDVLKCASATEAEKPQERPVPASGVYTVRVSNEPFADGCLTCSFEPFPPDDSRMTGRAKLQASITVKRDGTVRSVRLDPVPGQKMADAITGQISKWLFEPTHQGSKTVEVKKEVPLWLMCMGFPGRPETNNCSLHPPSEFLK